MDERDRQALVGILREAGAIVDDSLGVLSGSGARESILVNLAGLLVTEYWNERSQRRGQARDAAPVEAGEQLLRLVERQSLPPELKLARDLTQLAAEKGTRWVKRTFAEFLGMVMACAEEMREKGTRLDRDETGV